MGESTANSRELYKLIGNYEATTKEIFTRLEKIDTANGRILDTIRDIEGTCHQRRDELDRIEEQIEDLEFHDQSQLSRNSKLQILLNFIISIANILTTAWSKITA